MNEETDDNILTFITLKQSLSWAQRNCTPEAVQRLRSRAVVARLVEEIEKLQALLVEVNNDLDKGCRSGYQISHLTASDIDTYLYELDKS